MRIAIRHYDGYVQFENDAPNLTSDTIIRQTKYGPMRFKRTAMIGNVPVFTIPKPAEPTALDVVWSGGELLDDRATLPDTRWETFGAVLFKDDGEAA